MENGRDPLDGIAATQVGPFPPPYGGVSKFIRRLHGALVSRGMVSRVVAQCTCTTRTSDILVRQRFPGPSVWLRPLWYRLNPLPGDLLHWHDSWHVETDAMIEHLRRGKAVVITVHSELEMGRAKSLTKREHATAQRLARAEGVCWIAVSERIRRQLIAEGVSGSRIRVAPAFLPEIGEGEGAKLPTPLSRFLAAHTPNLCVYGWQLSRAQGADLYGFDAAITLVADMKKTWPSAGLVLFCPGAQAGGGDYEAVLRNLARAEGVEDSVFWLFDEMPSATPVWSAIDAYVRPTISDGDAVAIRECLLIGKPVVASDVADRPTGTITYHGGDRFGLLQAVHRALRDGPSQAGGCPPPVLETVLDCYREALIGARHREARPTRRRSGL